LCSMVCVAKEPSLNCAATKASRRVSITNGQRSFLRLASGGLPVLRRERLLLEQRGWVWQSQRSGLVRKRSEAREAALVLARLRERKHHQQKNPARLPRTRQADRAARHTYLEATRHRSAETAASASHGTYNGPVTLSGGQSRPGCSRPVQAAPERCALPDHAQPSIAELPQRALR